MQIVRRDKFMNYTLRMEFKLEILKTALEERDIPEVHPETGHEGPEGE